MTKTPVVICALCHEPAGKGRQPCACDRARARLPGLSRFARAITAAQFAHARGSCRITAHDMQLAATSGDA